MPEGLVVGRIHVGDMLDRLTPAERRVVVARLLDGESGEEVADRLGLASSTVRVLLARGRQKLREYLADTQSAGAAIGGAGLRFVHRVRHRILRGPGSSVRPVELMLPVLALSALAPAMGAHQAGDGDPHTSVPRLRSLATVDAATSPRITGARGGAAGHSRCPA